MNVHAKTNALVTAALLVCAGHVAAQVTLYEDRHFTGASFRASGEIPNLRRTGFNDRASSLIVERGRWEVCEDARFSGRCVVLRRGQYETLQAMGLNDRISSLRAVGRSAHNYNWSGVYLSGSPDYRRRTDERLYSVDVQSVRAVFGPPEQRCWIERTEVPRGNGSGYNIPGAIAGAVIGGILGHQVGGGRGQDIATAGGAVAGGAIGANIGRDIDGEAAITRDVRRCSTMRNDQPAYWDVGYEFRGTWHHAQMTAPPGPTILVNSAGEPRY